MLVSVAMITYNHEKYISEALDSVLMQKVDFEYEIVIGDDCSLDNTKAIILEYQKKYPNIIRVLQREKNMGVTNNFYDVLKSCKGQYIATLEGDDYWTDKNKLQRQINYMEANEQCAGVAHKYKKKNPSNQYTFGRQKKGKYTFRDFSWGILPGQTGTLCFRNFLHDKKDSYEIIKTASDIVGDRTLILLILLHGYMYCFDDYMSVYRINSTETSWSTVDKKKNLAKEYMRYFCVLTEYTKSVFGKKRSMFWPKGKCVYTAYAWFKSDKSKTNERILKEVLNMYDEEKIKLIFCFISLWIKSMILRTRH